MVQRRKRSVPVDGVLVISLCLECGEASGTELVVSECVRDDWCGVEGSGGENWDRGRSPPRNCRDLLLAAVRVLRPLLEEGRKWYFEDGQRRWSLGSISSSF